VHLVKELECLEPSFNITELGYFQAFSHRSEKDELHLVA